MTMIKQTVTAIIPAYNEAHTIGDVVSVVRSCSFVNEVIVVSDGSTDETSSIAKEAGAIVIDLEQNVGKGKAMIEGFQHTNAEVIIFLDADLIGLTTKHAEQLVRSVLDGKRVMQVGIRDRGTFWTRVSHHFPLISGERAIRRDVVKAIPDRFYHGFMIEVAFNYYCRSRKLSYGAVDLIGLSMRRKYQKVGWPKAVVQYVAMTAQIIRAMIIVRLMKVAGKF